MFCSVYIYVADIVYVRAQKMPSDVCTIKEQRLRLKHIGPSCKITPKHIKCDLKIKQKKTLLFLPVLEAMALISLFAQPLQRRLVANSIVFEHHLRPKNLYLDDAPAAPVKSLFPMIVKNQYYVL